MTRKQATIAVRSGLNDDEQYGCVVPPIHLSSTYNFTGFNEPRAHDYSRRGNPTRDVVQRALAELEGGAGAVLTNTGMSAIHLVTTVFLKPGDLLVAPHDCYGGSYRLFDSLAKRGCYRVLFVDQGDEQALRAALAEKPKLVLVESPSNPLLRVVDIAKICHLAREVGAVSVVDNTFLSPALQNPLALGADLVLHSCTKYLNGHSDVVAGVVIAKDPDVVTELAWWANNIGVTGGAFDSYLLLRGLRTLVPRMELAQRNAQAIVKYLQTQPLVKKLYHPSLPENQVRKEHHGWKFERICHVADFSLANVSASPIEKPIIRKYGGKKLMKSNLRNEIKSYIVRQGMTMQEVVDLLRDEHGWSDSVSNLSNKLQRESLRYVEAVQLADALGYEIVWQRRK